MLHLIKTVFEHHAEKLACCIGEQKYSYADFLGYISGIRQMLRKERPTTRFIGLAAYDDIETYASILALWAEGYAFVPLSSQSPAARNTRILKQVGSTFVLSSRITSGKLVEGAEINWLFSSGLQATESPPDFSKLEANQIRCMLFTSGSTGVPKGVPYTTKNINTTLDAFFVLGYQLSEADRFLQMFELTFDMSMLSYLPAWCIGASVHTVNPEGIKYLNAFKVMEEQELSVVTMVPSTLQLLQPYFSQVNLPAIRYCLVGGEPFYTGLAEAWMACVPNAQVVNISGPCETTMACMGYTLDRGFSKNKSHKEILAFGHPWKNTTVLLLDAKGELAKIGEEGELCFGGDHVMEGYWQMPEKNADLFFEREIENKIIRFYRSGDMAFQDAVGIYYSCGRKDIQYKIQGYKVELGDIEKHAQQFIQKGTAAAFVDKNEKGLLDIHLFMDQPDVDIDALLAYLKNQLPPYMWPRKVHVLRQLPLTISGKLDRGKLSQIFKGDDFEWILDEEMAGRITENLFATYQEAAKCNGIPIWQEGKIAAVDAHPSSWPRTLFGTPEITQVEKIAVAISEGKLPPHLIMQRPTHPEDLYYKLSDIGFRPMMSWPGMAIDLLQQNFLQKTSNITLIQTEEALKEWLDIVRVYLFKNDPLEWNVIKAIWESGRFLFYGLSENGKLASVAMGYILNQQLGIYMVATAAAHRRKGFAKALTLQILQDAKERDCRAAYLQASTMGVPMYTQIGFKPFCNFDIFSIRTATNAEHPKPNKTKNSTPLI